MFFLERLFFAWIDCLRLHCQRQSKLNVVLLATAFALLCATIFGAQAQAFKLFNVKNYNVKGDGSDQTAAIQNVLALASNQPGS